MDENKKNPLVEKDNKKNSQLVKKDNYIVTDRQFKTVRHVSYTHMTLPTNREV